MSTPPAGPPAPRPPAAGPSRFLVPVALAVIVASVVGLFLISDSPAAGVDDCIAQAGDGGIEVVGCDEPAAAYRVVGVLEDTRGAQSQPACAAAYPQTTASYFDGEATTLPGRVLCLIAA